MAERTSPPRAPDGARPAVADPVRGVGAAGMLIGDWGRSYRDSQPVLAVIGAPSRRDLRADGVSRAGGDVARHLGRRAAGRCGGYSCSTRSPPSARWWRCRSRHSGSGSIMIYVFSVDLGWLPAGSRFTRATRRSGLPASSHCAVGRTRAGDGRHLEPLHARLDARCDQPRLRAHRPRQGHAGRRSC